MKKYAPVFECEKCDYRCSKKFLWEQHCSTLKHKRQRSASPFLGSNTLFVCELCGKAYKQRSGLWRHAKKCNNVNICEDGINVGTDEHNSQNVKTSEIMKENMELKHLMQAMLTGFEKDTKMKDQMMDQMKEQSKIIQEMIPRLGNNNNNKFNINVFLNEKCRDAINMSEFIESLQIHLEDLDYTKTNGLIEGVSSIFVNGLKQLETFKRPIHCTDMKRETLYIKDNNEWDRGKEKLKTAINDVADKQRKAVLEWEQKNPGWIKNEKGKDEYIRLLQSVMGDVSTAPNENKIIKYIAKETTIDKE